MPQRVLITAGAAGIGREFARAFAATGARVFVCDIDAKALEAIAKEIPGLIARRCDMARRAEIERMVPDAVEKLGGLDVLINNAGVSGMTLPVADYPPDDWDKVLAHVVDRRPLRLCQPQPLCGDEMGRDRLHQDAGD